MRLILGSLFIFLWNLQVFSQSSKPFNFQGVARSANNKPVAEKSISVKFAVKSEDNEAGLSIYEENHVTTTTKYGTFNLAVGMGDPLPVPGLPMPSSFDEINWSAGDLYLFVSIDTLNAGNYVSAGSTRLLGVPYANYAVKSGMAESANKLNKFVNDWNIPDGFNNFMVLAASVSPGQTYSIPAGKNFYVSDIRSNDGLPFDSLTATWNGIVFEKVKKTPNSVFYVFGGGQTWTSDKSISFNGFLVDATVTCVTVNLALGSYTVPTGKMLVINAYAGSSVSINGLSFDAINMAYPGQVLSTSKNFRFTGYLVPMN